MDTIVYPKWFLKSKTFIFNLLALVFLAGPIASDALMELADLPEMEPHAKILLAIVAGINFLLRFKTFVPVSMKRVPDPVSLAPPGARGDPPSSGSQPVP